MELIKDINKIKFHSRQTPEQLRELEECKQHIEFLVNKRPKEAIDDCKLYLKKSKLYHSQNHIAESLYLTAYSLHQIGENVDSFNLCKISFEIAKEKLIRNKTRILLGSLHRYLGNFDVAINYYSEVLSDSDAITKPGIYNNLAVIYFKQKDFQKAIEYFNKALEITNNNDTITIGILNNIGRSYLELNDLINAEIVVTKALEMINNIENPTQEVINNQNIGLLYYKKELYQEAYLKLLTSYENCKKLNLRNNLYSSTIFLAYACDKTANLYQANLYFIEALELVKNSDKRLYVNTLKDYIDFLLEQEDFVNACKYFKEYDHVKDRIIQEEKVKEINELSIKFRNTEQKLEIEKLTKEKEMQSTLIAQAEEIKRYNEELVLSNAHLSQANSQLMETKILRSQMNPHFVYNTLNSISSLIKSKQNKAADQYLHVFSNLTRRIFDNNTQSSISLFEELDFCAQYILLEKLRFGDKINYVQTIDPAINIESIHIPSMIIQPLLENAIKHGVFHLKKKQIGIIQLNIQQQKNQLLFEVIDNGIGIKGSINEVLQSNQESAIHIVNKRINIYNQQDLDSQSLLLENTGSAGLKCSFNLNLNNNPYDQPNFSSR